jgi:hypothetical protein
MVIRHRRYAKRAISLRILLQHDSVPTRKESFMSKKSGLKPGTPAPVSAQYQQIGPRGGAGKEVTVSKGKPLPPTPTSGGTYTVVDPTKNKSGRG